MTDHETISRVFYMRDYKPKKKTTFEELMETLEAIARGFAIVTAVILVPAVVGACIAVVFSF